jgi:two-component system, OmpR family, response regulator
MNIPYGPILVVEDIPNVQELLEITLKFKGYPVVTANDGKELEKIARQRPAMIITDILMPKMDGYALAHDIRKNPLPARFRLSLFQQRISPQKTRNSR